MDVDLALSLLSTVSSPYKLHEISNFLRDHIRCDFVSCLPRELAVHVLSFLPLDSLTKASRVSIEWLLYEEYCLTDDIGR